MPKHIGIVACSAEGAALCYRTVCVEGEQLMGRHAHPEVSMHTFSLDEYMQPIYRNDWHAVGDLMLASAENPEDPVEELLRLGERQGYLTYEMLNERLPDSVVAPDKLDAFLMAVHNRGIRLIDESDAP